MQPTIANTTPQMAGALDPTTASLLGQLYPQQSSNFVSAQPAPAQPKENWLERLLPTAGGILGGIGGSFIAPFAGSVGGAALGSAVGKAAENALTGKSALQANDITAGLEGGVGQAAGFGLGKLAGGLLGKLATKTGGLIQNSQAEAALASEFPDAALKPAMKEKLNFGQSLNIADQAGVPKTAEGFVGARGVATGANGYLNGVLDHIVRLNGPVNLSGFDDMVTQALKQHPELGQVGRVAAGMKPTGSTAEGIRTLLNSALQQTGFGGQGTLSSELATDPDNALTLLRQVRDLAQPYKGAEPGTPGAAQGDVYDKVYKGLKNMIYNRPDVNAAIKSYAPTPDDIAMLPKLSVSATGSPQLAQHLLETVANAKNATDLLKPQAQFLDMGDAGERALSYLTNAQGTSQTVKAAAQAAQPATTILGSLTHGGLGKLGLLGVPAGMATGNPLLMAAAIPALLGSQTTKNVTTALADKLAGGGVQKGVSKLLAPAIMGTSQFLSHAPDYAQSGAGTMIGEGNTMQPTATQIPGQATSVQSSPQQQLYQAALIGMQDPYLYSSVAPLLQSATGPIQKAQTAEAALGSTEQAFNQAGAGQGLVGGLLSKLGGAITGGPTKTYAAQRAQLATVLTSLGIPSSAIPDVTATGPAAEAQWQTLANIVGSLGGNGLLATVPAS